MIGELLLKDFKTHKDSKLVFSSGINVITGDTGQGKTNILLALNWAVNNRPLGSNCIRRGQDSTTVIAKVIDDKNACSVIRSRGESENSYDIEKGGVSIVGEEPLTAFGNSPPKEVLEILNLSDINIQKQRDKHFLVYTSPGQIATYIRSVTKLDEIDRVTKLLFSKIRTKKTEISCQQEELKSTNKKLVILNKIDLELLQNKIVEAKDVVLKIKQIEEKIARIGRIITALRTLEKHWIRIPDNVDEMFADIDSRQNSITQISLRLSPLKILIEKIKKIEACKISLPDDVDKIFENIDSRQKSIVEISSRLSPLKILIDKIKTNDACEISLPKDLTILSTVEQSSEKYENMYERINVFHTLLEEIYLVEIKIENSDSQLKKLRCEEKQLMEELTSCPECGVELTEESKRVLLCD